ncbi:hypothetical protein [Bdellovibrio sp. HCB2-146]|uniref:hypothetical protein n=1 Tax=Bdellovibrio sp. HCB2-146 TaxID=3394362 RepID=UPI0039BC7B77
MKKLNLFFIVSSIGLYAFGATRHLDCVLEDSGEVNLSFVYSEASPQRFNAFIGREKWSNPYAISKACELIKAELVGDFKQLLGVRECFAYGQSSAETQFTIDLTEKGAELTGNKARTTLLFRPIWPVSDEFLSIEDDSTCIDYY